MTTLDVEPARRERADPGRRARQGARRGHLRLRAGRAAAGVPAPAAVDGRPRPDHRVDATAAEALDGVLLVLTHVNAPRLADTSDGELRHPPVARRRLPRPVRRGGGRRDPGDRAGTPRTWCASTTTSTEHDTELRDDHPDCYTPDKVNPAYPTDTEEGDVDAALADAAVVVDATLHDADRAQQPDGAARQRERLGGRRRLTVYDSTQGAHGARPTLAKLFGLTRRSVRVVSPHVGGGFGSQGHAARAQGPRRCWPRRPPGRPVKLALTRQQMFALVGYRTPTIQRVRLGADRGRPAHRDRARGARADLADQGVRRADRGRHPQHVRRRRTGAPRTGWSRSTCRCRPGCGRRASAPACSRSRVGDGRAGRARSARPGRAAGPQRPRARPGDRSPVVEPAPRRVPARRRGALRLGPSRPPGRRREGRWLVGIGVASSTYPAYVMPGSVAQVEHTGDGRYVVRIGAADIGTGARTVLTQVAADALRVPVERVRVEIGDTALPTATVEGGSAGLASHGSAVVEAARRFREEHGSSPAPGARTESSRRRTPTPAATPPTPTAHSSSRSGSTRTPARSGCRG